METSHININPENDIPISASFKSGHSTSWAILHRNAANKPICSSEQCTCTVWCVCMLGWLFVTCCHLSSSISVMRPLHSCRLSKLPGCGGFRLKSVTLILFCMPPWAGADKSWACSACSLVQMNLSPFPSGNHLAKSAQHHILTNILAYHNTAMQVLDQSWLISILLEAQTEGFGFVCTFFLT